MQNFTHLLGFLLSSYTNGAIRHESRDILCFPLMGFEESDRGIKSQMSKQWHHFRSQIQRGLLRKPSPDAGMVLFLSNLPKDRLTKGSRCVPGSYDLPLDLMLHGNNGFPNAVKMHPEC